MHTKNEKPLGEKMKITKEEREMMIRYNLIKPGETFEPSEITRIYQGRNKVAICGLIKRYKIFDSFFLAVYRSFWNQGIGSKITEDYLRNKTGIIFLTVKKSNKHALRIYQKNGFKTIMNWRSKKILMIRIKVRK